MILNKIAMGVVASIILSTPFALEISAGNYNTFAIKDNLLFMTDNKLETANGESNWRIIAFDVDQADIDDKHAVLLSTFKDAYVVGENIYGELGIDIPFINSFRQIDYVPNIKSVKSENHQSFLIDSNNNLWAAGWNHHGFLNKDKSENIKKFEIIKENVRHVESSVAFIAIITIGDELWVKGHTNFGFQNEWTKIAENVKEISGGITHLLYVDSDNTAWGIGSNMNYQLGLNVKDKENILLDNKTDRPILLMKDVKKVAAGNYHSIILKNDGVVYTVGNNGNGQLGLGDTQLKKKWSKTATEIDNVFAGGQHSILLRNDGWYGFAGNNSQGQLGFKQETDNSKYYGENIITNNVDWVWTELNL
jgi:alpha-tubulin suppressor-like RCC1 family protein